MIKEKNDVQKLVGQINYNSTFLLGVYETNTQIINCKSETEKKVKTFEQIKNESIDIFDTEDPKFVRKMFALKKLVNELKE